MRGWLVLLAMWPALAGATPRRWAIGEIRVEGVAPAEQTALEERAWRALSLALPLDAWVAPHDAVMQALAGAPTWRGCAEDRCSLALGDRLGVERLLTVRLGRQGRDWTARLLVFAVDAAEVASTLEVPCAGCDADALLAAFARAAVPLLRDERVRPLCTLSVSAAVGAPVSVDTVPLGAAPFAHTVVAGRHTVAIDGAARPAEVDCPAGATRALALASTAPSHARPWRLALGVAAGGLALGGVAGLATAAAYHDRPACDGGRCAFRYDATAGIAVGAAAAVLLGGAAVWLLVSARRPLAASPTIRVSEALVPRSAGVAEAR